MKNLLFIVLIVCIPCVLLCQTKEKIITTNYAGEVSNDGTVEISQTPENDIFHLIYINDHLKKIIWYCYDGSIRKYGNIIYIDTEDNITTYSCTDEYSKVNRLFIIIPKGVMLFTGTDYFLFYE